MLDRYKHYTKLFKIKFKFCFARLFFKFIVYVLNVINLHFLKNIYLNTINYFPYYFLYSRSYSLF